jgi:hypothetical protein
VAGTIDGSLAFGGGDGNDSLTLTETAVVGNSVKARLGAGANMVTHAGTVEGDLRVVSNNENDIVDIAETAIIGGETELGLGEQFEGRGPCRNRAWTLDTLMFNGRPLGFFLRGLMR